MRYGWERERERAGQREGGRGVERDGWNGAGVNWSGEVLGFGVGLSRCDGSLATITVETLGV